MKELNNSIIYANQLKMRSLRKLNYDAIIIKLSKQ